MINSQSAGQANDVAAGFSAVNDLIAVLNAAGVDGVHHGDFDFADLLRASLIHAVRVRDTLRFEPRARFEDPDDLRLVLRREIDGIADMIEVSVSDKHDVDAVKLLERIRTSGIALHPGIDDDDFAARRGDAECRVAKPRQLIASRLQHDWPTSLQQYVNSLFLRSRQLADLLLVSG